MFTKTTIAICVAAAFAANAKDQGGRIPIAPYGTDAEIRQCVADKEASLNGRSILGSRDTAIYIQDRANLDDMGMTEYGVMVDRCRTMFFRRYMRPQERQPR